MEDIILEKLKLNGYNASRNSILIYKVIMEKKSVKNIPEIKETLKKSYITMSSTNIKNIIIRLFNIGVLSFEESIEGIISNIRLKN